MLLHDRPQSAADVERPQDADAHQWEQYLQEQNLWEHFLSFAPEAIQWTYNVQ
jgi:hypothetical protein